MLPSSVPTMNPSYSPSNSPSVNPTLSPSAYPTYTSTVHVYFVVIHALSGISATTYSSSKELNDAVLKQTIVSMLGYDSSIGDVIIQLVSDARQSRSISSSIEVTYSITTLTRIFNNTIQATTLFIQALNESISTGAFDKQLHVNIGTTTNWQSVATAYAIFSTASPTSSPTSTPTSFPTKTDLVAASILAIPLDDKVAKAKIKYYLGTFVGYFLAIYIFLYLYSFLRYGKAMVTQLYDTSYQSELHVQICATSDNNVQVLSDLYRYNAAIKSTMMLEEEMKTVKLINRSTPSISSVSGKSLGNSSYNITISGMLANIVNAEDENKYSKGYREYMQQQRTLLGCSPFLYPDGYVVNIPCARRKIHLPPGRIEDILLFIFHNHTLLSCFYFMDGSKLGAHGTRILYIGKDVVVFVLYQFSNMLLQYYMLDYNGLGTLVNLFIVTPSAVSIGLLLKYLYTCPFTETADFQTKFSHYKSTALFLGRLAIVPIMIIMYGSLIVACLFSSDRRIPMILVNYFLYVQFYGILLEIAVAFLLFVDNYYYRMSLFGVLDVLCIGQLFMERIVVEQLVVDVDYAYRINSYLFGFIKEQKILNRDDAIKAKWITEGKDKAYDIDMRGDVCRVEDAFAVPINPLQEELFIRNSAIFSMDGIFGDGKNDEELGDEYDVYNSSNNDTHDTLVPTENPIHSLVPAVTIDEQRASTKSKPNKVIEEVSVVAEDDAALYLEYQSLQKTQFDAMYPMGADDSEVVMSFEEWKIRRKQFKQGTDYSLLFSHYHTYLSITLTHSLAYLLSQ